MSVDYIVASLPPLRLDEPAPISRAKFDETCGERAERALAQSGWADLEAQLRNALAEARTGNGDFARPVSGCSLYWKNRVLACFAETDVAKRELLIDRVWWDAAGELTPPASPLGPGALATYAIRLAIVLRRAKISTADGNASFDRLTSSTKINF